MNLLPRIIPGFDRILHGGDYNPDQWQRHPEVLAADQRLIAQAGLNVVTLGVFAWSSYEKKEGELDFGWLDRSMDALAGIGCHVILATPSGAKPPWMSLKYPEIRRVTRDGLREPHTGRHNHCWSSPVYREKVAIINEQLARRYAGHPALCLWHVSNEYAGKCYCDLCKLEFQRFLEQKYASIEALNDAWCSEFWGYGYADFSEIDPRGQLPEGLNLDHNHFYNRQLVDFMRWEMKPLRALTPTVPCSTNFMGTFGLNDYSAIAAHVDLVCDDQYPGYDAADAELPRRAAAVSFKDDLYRAMKPDRPWLLMESSPDVQNWRQPMRLKRPGLHRLEMLQALAHGAEGTCYFQIRKSRGGSEKYHGAVIDHAGHADTRVFRSIVQLSEDYTRLSCLLGTRVQAEVAFVYDWPARWALELSSGPVNKNEAYDRVSHAHYLPFWSRGVSVDVIAADKDFAGYRLLVTPQLFALDAGVAERIARFVARGGVWVATHYTAYCDSHNRCFLGGLPGAGLRRVLGLWNEEVDSLPEGASRLVIPSTPAAPGAVGYGLPPEMRAQSVCEIVHLEGAEALAVYAEDFYAGHAALSVNRHGAGQAFYHAARLPDAALDAFYGGLITRLGLARAVDSELPPGVTAQRRLGAEHELVFLLSFAAEPRSVELGDATYESLLSGTVVTGALPLPAFGVAVLRRARSAARR
jgi:beta-galactosidase